MQGENNHNQGGQPDNIVPFQRKQGVLNTTFSSNEGMWTEQIGTIFGVQLIEDGKIMGVALYSEQYKADTIARALNQKFAELRVRHEAKIIHYPVY